MKYEDAINKIQGNGRFHLIIMLILSIICFNTSIDIISVAFLTYTPNYKCNTNNLTLNNDIINFTWIKNQCNGYYYNTSNDKYIEYKCNAWIYDKSVMKRTMINEYDLICDKASLGTTINTIYFIGIALGNLIGIFGDKIGRKRIIILTCILEVVTNLLLPLITNLWFVVLFRFLWGLSYSKVYQAICLMIEILSIDKRSFYGNNIWLFWVFGYMTLPLIQYAVLDWRFAKWIANCLFIFYILLYFVPESPRWLSIVGRHQESIDTLIYIGYYNGVKLNQTDFNNLIVEKPKSVPFKKLIKFRNNNIKIIIGIIVQSAINLGYIGISVNGSYISDNLFLNIFAGGAVELLTGPVGWIASSKLNRRWSLFIFYLLTMIFMIISAYIPRNTIQNTILQATFGCFAKFTITTAYCIVDMYLPEIFPTQVRNLTMFIIISFGAFVTVLAPTINIIDQLFYGLSSIIYGMACFLSAILILFLPETKGCPLPETFDEGEELRRGNERKYKQRYILEIKNNYSIV